MTHRTAFWILIFLTVISASLQLFGFEFMEVMIVLLILDSIGFGAIVELERKKSFREEEVGKAIKQKIDNLEEVCKDVTKRVNVNAVMEELEAKLGIHKQEHTDSMDRIAKKTLDLERKLNKFGATLAEHLQINNTEENVADYIYLENEE